MGAALCGRNGGLSQAVFPFPLPELGGYDAGRERACALCLVGTMGLKVWMDGFPASEVVVIVSYWEWVPSSPPLRSPLLTPCE